jgi:pilus assembly protein CpaE
MTRAAIPQSLSSIAVFTVSADAALASLISDVSGAITGAEFAGEFHEYVSPGQRLHFPQNMRDALCCVAFIDFDRDPEAALQTAETLNLTSAPRITAIGMSSHPDKTLLLRAMRAGCSEFLEKPVSSDKFHETLERIQSRLVSTMESSSGRGRLLSIFGAKGGVGTTTLAVHLASYLVKRHGKKTLLIDHAHQLGHACLYLGLKEGSYHFDQLIRNSDRLDSDLLNGFLVRHASGLAVVSSPDTCTEPLHASTQEIERIFDFLRHEYDYIVVDSSLQHEELARPTIQFSDEVYLVATPDIAAIRDMSRHIENLSLSSVASQRLRIVINRASSHDAIGADQIEKAVRFPVSLSIPNVYTELLHAINAGEPIFPNRRSDFTTQLTRWSDMVVSRTGEAAAAAPAGAKKKFAFWK